MAGFFLSEGSEVKGEDLTISTFGVLGEEFGEAPALGWRSVAFGISTKGFEFSKAEFKPGNP